MRLINRKRLICYALTIPRSLHSYHHAWKRLAVFLYILIEYCFRILHVSSIYGHTSIICEISELEESTAVENPTKPMGATSPLLGQGLHNLRSISKLCANLVDFRAHILKPLCNLYTSHIKKFSDRNMQMYVGASIIGCPGLCTNFVSDAAWHPKRSHLLSVTISIHSVLGRPDRCRLSMR
jgi:hypothetical protein